MQSTVVTILLAGSIVALAAAVVGVRSRGIPAMGVQLAVGTTVGAVAAASVVAFRADLVPDEIEIVMAVALVVMVAASVIPLLLHRAR